MHTHTMHTHTYDAHTPHTMHTQTLDEWQKEYEQGKKGHRFAKMRYDGWYKK